VPITTMHEMFTHELGDILDAERQFLKGQAEMAKNATDATLRAGIEKHMAETERHIANVERVFTLVGEEPKAEKCPVAAGLVTEAKQGMKEARVAAIRDCLIGEAAEKVEHYEIVSYRGLIASAEALGQAEAVKLLQENLAQEEKTAQALEKGAPGLLKKALAAGT
jgi:ferritin-like metal-binding protein YciE